MKKSETKKLDKMWGEIIHNNFNNKCVLCGKGEYTNAHHYVGRQNVATRWYIPCGVLLCAGEHTFKTKSAHKDPEWFRTEMLKLWGEEWLKRLTIQSNKIFKGTFQEVKDYLEGKDTNYACH